jgi:hypothetical protein
MVSAGSGQVLEHRLEQGLGDGQARGQILVAMDAALGHELQELFEHG